MKNAAELNYFLNFQLFLQIHSMNIFTNFVFNNFVNTIKSNENDLFANRFFDSFLR